MSHNRSKPLIGLVAGLVAALVCAAGLGAAVLFQNHLPAAVRTFGNGHPLSAGLSLVIAVVIALAVGAARPRGAVLPVVAALYAGGAVMAGQIVGSSVMEGALARRPGVPLGVADVTLANFLGGLSGGLGRYGARLSESWPVWTYIGVAALAALLLVTLRVLRLRRADRRPAGDGEEPDGREPEYRAPFEPAQPTPDQPTTDLFTPRKPARG
ncbi:hypothetical protein [Nonomuraea sp. NPDC050783]|uniref:hypothetical protein n=1 Tax=Nonomuraea sp. NPDC050783 TaxID=3154634 RepID=UPI003466F4F3